MNDPRQALFRETLPSFVNGTASESERQFMTQYLRENPSAQAELRFEAALQAAVRAATERRPQDAGLARLLRDWKAGDARAEQPRPESLGDRIRRWKDAFGLTPAFALAASLALVQAGLLISHDRPGIASDFRGSVAGHGADGPLLLLTPKPDIPYATLAELIRTENASIVSGPDESGLLMLALPVGGRPEETVQRLLDSGLLDDAVIVPTRK